jgi:diacylglycerol kinase family enzyme
VSPTGYALTALRQFLTNTDRRTPALTLHRPGAEPVGGLFLGIVSNQAPWTYFGNRPVVLTPNASFDRGLDLAALRRLRTLGTLWAASGMLTGGGLRGRSTLVFEDLSEFRLEADRPMHFEVDGEYLGEREDVTFRAVPRALRVVG